MFSWKCYRGFSGLFALRLGQFLREAPRRQWGEAVSQGQGTEGEELKPIHETPSNPVSSYNFSPRKSY